MGGVLVLTMQGFEPMFEGGQRWAAGHVCVQIVPLWYGAWEIGELV